MTATDVLKALGDTREAAQLRQDLPQLSFSQTVLVAAVGISGQFPQELTLESGVIRSGHFSACSLRSDHVVVGRFWHPVSRGSIDDLSSAMARLSLVPGRIAAGDYFRLVSTSLGRAEFRSQLDLASLASFDGPPLPVPDGFQGRLYPYQASGASMLQVLATSGTGSFLADEMGLGKTVQAIVLLLATGWRDNLVVVPASLIENWRRELRAFAPGLSVFTHLGPGRYGVADPLRGHHVVLTTFETVVNDLSVLDEVSWNLVIVDEAQQIRNPDTRRAAAVKQLPRRLSLAVTGTPVQNRLRDLWSIAEFVVPQLLGRRDDFERDFPDETAAAKRLGEVMAPVTVRRLVADVADDLPELVEYSTAIAASLDFLSRYAEARDAGPSFETQTTLRALCAHADEGVGAFGVFLAQPKVSHLLALLEEVFERREKALVFTSFHGASDRLQTAVRGALGRSFIGSIDGRTAVAARQDVIDQFSAAGSAGCLFLNPQAAGVGLNITAANHVIHFNPEYNPQVTRQATARTYRRGQERPVFVHHLFYADTIEEDAVNIALAKADLSEALDQGLS